MKDPRARASGKVKPRSAVRAPGAGQPRRAAREFDVDFPVARPTPLSEIGAMDSYRLPSEAQMREAFLRRDATYDGIFWAGVRSTGVFCRPSCSARNPLPENLSFFDSPDAAERAGFRPCQRCRPFEEPGASPAWLTPLVEALDADPARRWTERDLRALGLAPERVRRWFQKTHGMTFQAYHRARRLGSALERVQAGSPVTHAAFDAGYDSLSGFQEAFRNAFGAPPTKLDKALLVRVDQVVTPLGPMFVGASERAVHVLEFADRQRLDRQLRRTTRLLGTVFVPAPSTHGDRLRAQLAAYFEGASVAFDVPLEPAGTGFQRDVWASLATVPPATTVSYGDVAEGIGRQSSVRAVGAAIGANPLAIVVPCHRVVGGDGRLTGYAGGLWRKQRLLELERRAEQG